MKIDEALLLSFRQLSLKLNLDALSGRRTTSNSQVFATLLKTLFNSELGKTAATPQTRATTQKQPDGIQSFDSQIRSIGAKYGVDPDLIRQVISAESGYDADALSSAGAQGLMQLMPATAESYGVTNPNDPIQNIEGGTNLLSDLLNRYNGNVSLALAAYNAGPGAVDKYGGVPPYEETINYVNKIVSGLNKIDHKA